MMTFKITNIRIEDERMVAFYEFGNGEVNSNAFPLTATAMDMKAWGEEKASFYEANAIEREELRQFIIEQEMAKAEAENGSA